MLERFRGLARKAYQRLVLAHDSPHKIAFGFGLGIFSGIFPGTGPIAVVFLATLFKVNTAVALLACLLTNTWLSLVTLFLSIKTGSVIMQLDWRAVYADWQLLLKNFRWSGLFKLSVLKIILPVITGYLIIAFCLGVLAYILARALLALRKNENKS